LSNEAKLKLILNNYSGGAAQPGPPGPPG